MDKCWYPGCPDDAAHRTKSLIPASKGIVPRDRSVCEKHWKSLRVEEFWIKNGSCIEVPLV